MLPIKLTPEELQGLRDYVYNRPPLSKEALEIIAIYQSPVYQKAADLYMLLEHTARWLWHRIDLWKEEIKTKYVPLHEYLRMSVDEYREFLADWKNSPKGYFDRWHADTTAT